MTKATLFARWGAHLQGLRDALREAQEEARAGTRVDGAHRPSNRGERAAVTGQGYLAAGLADRIAALDAALDLLGRMQPAPRDTVVTGAQVVLECEEGGATLHLAILPGGDGSVIDEWLVVSVDSPIARASWGRSVDDDVELTRQGESATWVLVEVA